MVEYIEFSLFLKNKTKLQFELSEHLKQTLLTQQQHLGVTYIKKKKQRKKNKEQSVYKTICFRVWTLFYYYI